MKVKERKNKKNFENFEFLKGDSVDFFTDPFPGRAQYNSTQENCLLVVIENVCIPVAGPKFDEQIFGDAESSRHWNSGIIRPETKEKWAKKGRSTTTVNQLHYLLPSKGEILFIKGLVT